MKISCILLVFGLSCGWACALPQDWPCEAIEVIKTDVISDAKDDFEYRYYGETDKYILDVNLSGSHQYPLLFANCGTSGCSGIIKEKSTGRAENLRFFCEEHSDDFVKVKCAVGFGEEAVFDKRNDNEYVVHYCADDFNKMLYFNLNECKKCHCIMHWADGEKNISGEYMMGCTKEQDKIHCFTYGGYEEWCDFKNDIKDYENCVGLKL